LSYTDATMPTLVLFLDEGLGGSLALTAPPKGKPINSSKHSKPEIRSSKEAK